jgi:hypothetical protein
MSTHSRSPRTTPWHVWAVAILTLVWNGSGTYTIVMAQMGKGLDMDANEIAYYAHQPFWFVITTDIALLSAVAAAAALLLRAQAAAWLFALSLAAIVANNVYELAAGTSLALAASDWRILTAIIVAIALLQFAYAWAMKTRGVLR